MNTDRPGRLAHQGPGAEVAVASSAEADAKLWNADPFPQLRLNRDALDHNIRTMAMWCQERGVDLAPHVKTTMSEKIVAKQVAAGAIGLTVATVDQAASVLNWGHRNILIANQIVDRHGLTRIRRWLEQDPTREIRCFVDSAEGVHAAAQIFDNAACVLEVLIDVGMANGRTGIRIPSDAAHIAALVRKLPGLRLGGVAGYEGVVPNNREEATLDAVDQHCRLTRDIYLQTARFFETTTPIYSMGGSAFPDRVVEFLPEESQVPGTKYLLRSGCYATHDHGTYASVTPVPGLVPALSVRAVVLSVPEDALAVVGAGKRDFPYDAGLPVFLSARTAEGAPKPGASAGVRNLFDHHLVLTDAIGLSVADVVEFGIYPTRAQLSIAGLSTSL